MICYIELSYEIFSASDEVLSTNKVEKKTLIDIYYLLISGAINKY
jgi:hypothetical protein